MYPTGIKKKSLGTGSFAGTNVGNNTNIPYFFD